MRSAILLLFGVSAFAGEAIVADRIAVIVGKRVVKASDLEGDLRVSQFLNNQALDLSPATRRRAADRLIDQELIRQDLVNGDYGEPSDADVTTYLDRLRQDRFRGSDQRFREAITRYGLSEERLRRHLRWQLTVLHFIDRRFRPGVLVTDEDVSAYYQEHRAELQKASPKNRSLEALEPSIREILTGDRINQLFEEWVAQKRKSTRIEYREAAFKTGVSR